MNLVPLRDVCIIIERVSPCARMICNGLLRTALAGTLFSLEFFCITAESLSLRTWMVNVSLLTLKAVGIVHEIPFLRANGYTNDNLLPLWAFCIVF